MNAILLLLFECILITSSVIIYSLRRNGSLNVISSLHRLSHPKLPIMYVIATVYMQDTLGVAFLTVM